MVDLEDFQVAFIQPKKQQKNYIFACDFDPFFFFLIQHRSCVIS